MERLALEVTTREIGKGPARRARKAGNVPAVLYGRERKPVAITVCEADVQRLLKTAPDLNAIVDLRLDGASSQIALVRDYQADVLTRRIVHLDLQAIDLTHKIEVEVTVNLVGTPIGVKDEGGVLEHLRRRIHVKALATAIPRQIDVDVSGLKIGDNIHANDVILPEGVEFLHATNFAIAAVVPPSKEEAPAPAVTAEAAATPEGAAAPAAPGGAEKKEEAPAKKEKAEKA